MKKLFILMSVVALTITSVAYSAAATYSTVDAVYEYGGLFYDIPTPATDTITGAGDTVVLLTKKIFDPDWQYILVKNKLLGASCDGSGTDSVKLQVLVESLDSDNELLYSTPVDSITTAAGEQIFLPLFGTIVGSKVRIKIISYTDNGGDVVLDKFQIYKRRPVTINKNWR